MHPIARVATGAVVVSLLWIGAHALQSSALAERGQWPASDDYIRVPEARVAPLVYAGYNELFADITWARALVYYGSARLGESDLRYLEKLIDNVLALDPKFRRVYSWAAYSVTFNTEESTDPSRKGYITATEEEYRTSVRYLRLGIEEFPDDFDLHQTLALRLWWDIMPESEDDKRALREEAAAIMERAVALPSAPPDAATTAANLWTELGEIEHAKRTLRRMLLTTDNKAAQKKMIERFRLLFDADHEAELLEQAKVDFDALHRQYLPMAPPDLFVILGPPPARAIRPGELGASASRPSRGKGDD